MSKKQLQGRQQIKGAGKLYGRSRGPLVYNETVGVKLYHYMNVMDVHHSLHIRTTNVDLISMLSVARGFQCFLNV